MPFFFHRALILSNRNQSVDHAFQLIMSSGVDLLETTLPNFGMREINAFTTLNSTYSKLAWSLSKQTSGLPTRLYHMLLFTMPGTPVFNRGDEVGLKAGVSTDGWIDRKDLD